MVYVVGVVGFLGGFALGLWALRYILKDRSNADLVSDKSLRMYGLVTWLIAVLGAASAMALWGHYMG